MGGKGLRAGVHLHLRQVHLCIFTTLLVLHRMGIGNHPLYVYHVYSVNQAAIRHSPQQSTIQCMYRITILWVNRKMHPADECSFLSAAYVTHMHNRAMTNVSYFARLQS